MRKTAVQKKLDLTKRTAMAAFIGGAAVSISANMISADHTPLGMAVGTWPAVALLMSIHLFQHVRRNPWVKVAIFGVVAVAAWMSYWAYGRGCSYGRREPRNCLYFPRNGRCHDVRSYGGFVH